MNQQAARLSSAVDVTVCLIALAACVLWTRADQWGDLDDGAFAAYILVGLYMLVRFWSSAVNDDALQLLSDCRDRDLIEGTTSGPPECFDLIWVTRSSSLAAAVLPVLERECARLHAHWHAGSATRAAAATLV